MSREGAIIRRGAAPLLGRRSPARPVPWRLACRLLFGIAAIKSLPASAFVAHATDVPGIVRNTYGEVGALETPSAHMAADGEFGFTFGDVGQQQRYGLTFQALPWLEASFRYSHVTGRFGGYNANHYYDRTFGVKFRVLKEGLMVPEFSVGLRDILGTGVFSGEYIVASKNLGPFDVSGGLGWGALAERAALPNPLGLAFNSFKTRDLVTTGGAFNSGQLFHGENVGAFGSVIWQTPIDSLQVLAEYSSDKYTGYVYRGGIRVKSPFNIGIAYRPFQALGMTAGWMYGDTYGLTVTLSGDPTTTYPNALRIGPDVSPPAIRTDDQQLAAIKAMQHSSRQVQKAEAGGPFVNVEKPVDAVRLSLLQSLKSEARGVRDVDVQGKSLVIDAHVGANPTAQCAHYAQIAAATGDVTSLALTDLENPDGVVTICSTPSKAADVQTASATGSDPTLTPALFKKLKQDIQAQKLVFAGANSWGNVIWVYFENYNYRNDAEAVGRVTRVLMADLPPDFEIFRIIPCVLGVPGQEIDISRSGMERALVLSAASATVADAVNMRPASLANPGFDLNRYPVLSWSIDPKLTQRVFDPDHPIQFMVYADAPALLQISRGLLFSVRATAKLWSNYTFNRPADSALPHVRSDILEYLKHGKYGISDLSLTYRTRLAPEVYAEMRGGYLEDMFMGGGGQILWRPEHSRLSFGADLYQVWQRNYNRLFGLRNYGVLTGHASVYYESPWYDVNFAIHAGRYLAGDYGGTFEITRRFDSGVEIGAWATFTNVPFSKFGEGSFDKGIIIHIPLEWGLPIWSQSAYDLHLNSLTRDGGQRLAGDDSLYAATRGQSYGELSDHLDDVINP